MRNIFPDRLKKVAVYEVPEIADGEIKLDAQENPYPLPESVLVKIKDAVSGLSLNRYPDPSANELRKKIADYCKVKAKNIVIGNGSDELILSLLIACGGRNRKTVCPEPTFAMYKILSDITGTEYSGVSLEPRFKLPDKKILSTRPTIIFIAMPNNPTGNCFDRTKILNIAEKTEGLVVVDEAYYEFSGETFAGEIDKYKNIIVLRTFSKAFSLAGIRAGYIIAHESIVKYLRKVQLPYNFSIINQKILEIILDERDSVLSSVGRLIKSREEMFAELKKFNGIEPYPSKANFILMKIKKIKNIVESLKKHSIRVREFNDDGLRNFLRVTIGTENENKNFLDAVREVL